MASEYFLKIEGVEGSSDARGHEREIDVLSFSWGVAQTSQAPVRAGGGASGKAEFSSLNVMKFMDKASATLLQGCASGKHFPSAVLSARKAGGSQQEYLTIKMSDILVSSVQQSGAAGGDVVPTESLSLNFAKVEFEFKEPDDRGKF